MKTDRELLELAGKAADIPARVIGAAGGLYNCDERGWHHQWNPLDNDGDALRLAGKMRLNIYFGHNGEGPINVGQFGADGATEWDAGTEQESLRRAIVRSAAAIGEAMP